MFQIKCITCVNTCKYRSFKLSRVFNESVIEAYHHGKVCKDYYKLLGAQCIMLSFLQIKYISINITYQLLHVMVDGWWVRLLFSHRIWSHWVKTFFVYSIILESVCGTAEAWLLLGSVMGHVSLKHPQIFQQNLTKNDLGFVLMDQSSSDIFVTE